MTVKFNQCNTDVTKVTLHFQYAEFTNQMLQCFSVTAYLLTKNLKKMKTTKLIVVQYFGPIALSRFHLEPSFVLLYEFQF